VDWTKYRVYNLEITHAERTAEREPVPADHPINTPCLHDLLAAPLSDVEVVRKKIRAQVERLPQTLELGQPRSDDISAPAHWQTPLYYAAVRAPVELVKLLLDLGAEVDAFSSRGVTPLVGAILQRRFDAVELLLEHGASLDVPNVVVVDDQEVKTYPPIVAAARVGEKELVLRALEAGASIDARGRSADQDDESKRERLYTPLTAAITGAGPSWAVNQPHGELVELLLERGASLNLTAECLSPLEAAEFSAELVQRLIDAGAEAKGPVNSTLLLAALGERDGHDSIPDAEKAVALISAGARTDAPNALALACKLKTRCEYFERPYTGEMGLTIVNALLDAGADPNYAWHTMPLCFAAAYPQPDFAIVEALLEGGAEIDQRDGKRITPLRYAIGQNEDDRLANMLLDRGASIERGDGHWSPLHDAVWVGKLAIAARLLERGASVEETTSDGRTPINVAAWNDQVEAIRWLLERGADPDGGETGWSALMAAARKNNVEAVKLLLDAGADPERKGTLPWDENDKTRRTAQEHAEAEGAGAAADALGKRTGKAFASLHRAVEADDLGEVQRLLAEGAKADRADGEHQRRPAHLARSAPVLAALLDAGAKVDGPDKHGNTPLMLAAQGGHPGALAMVQLLIERGADLNKRARGSQQTPLTAAAGGGELDIVEGLLEAGAKVRCKDYSPLHAAAAKGRVEVIKRLLDAGAEVDAWSHDGVGKRTPLGEAACCGHLEAARLLLAAGASSSKRDDTPGDDEDEDYWCYAGYNAVSHAASQGNYDVLKLLLAEGDGGVFDETADHSYPEDLAEGHPRCQALIRAWIDGKSPEEFEADEQAAQAAAAEARASAEAGDDLYLQKVEAPFVHHGDRSLPGKVKLKYGDWSVLFPSGYAFCLIHSMGKYEVRVADVEGVHELPEQLVQPSFTYCQSPDATRMLLVAGQRLIEINLATRAMRDLYTAERKIDCAGYARDAVYALDSEGLCYMPYGEGEGALKPAWTLPRGEEVETLESTGGALICIVTKSNTRRVVFATLDGEGMRHHARVELENPLTRVWFHRGPDDEQQRVFAMDSWSDTDATFYELHNVGITGRGELAEQVLAKPIVDDLPLTPVVD
jgi:ankyrin repeat protein